MRHLKKCLFRYFRFHPSRYLSAIFRVRSCPTFTPFFSSRSFQLIFPAITQSPPLFEQTSDFFPSLFSFYLFSVYVLNYFSLYFFAQLLRPPRALVRRATKSLISIITIRHKWYDNLKRRRVVAEWAFSSDLVLLLLLITQNNILFTRRHWIALHSFRLFFSISFVTSSFRLLHNCQAFSFFYYYFHFHPPPAKVQKKARDELKRIDINFKSESVSARVKEEDGS